jgi:hypothetical protein
MGTINFSEIAARVAAGSNDVRACLIVSQDGLTLGVFPEEGEASARAAWSRIVSGGDPEPERGFLTVGEETWAFTRRGGYGALATADRAVRPGVLLDALDGALREAHQERLDTTPAPAPARRVSEPVTPASRSRSATPATHSETPRRPERRPTPKPPGPPVRRLAPEDVEEEPATSAPVEKVEEQKAPVPVPAPAIPRVDTVELTREFGGLFDGPGGR